MNVGICFYFGYKTDVDERAKLIKETGFDCVIANADEKFSYQNGDIDSQVKLFKKYNLKLSSLHQTYNSEELPEFWKDSEMGDKLEQRLIQDVGYAKKYGFSCVVVHLKGEPSEVGLDRLKRILSFCEETKIPLAIENISNSKCFWYALENIKSDYLKICYDIGHQHCFDPNTDYLKMFKDKIIALHLHSNDGTSDMHTLNKYGNVDWNDFAKKYVEYGLKANLDYEILMCFRKDETQEQVLQETYKQACELKKLIAKYKKLKNK